MLVRDAIRDEAIWQVELLRNLYREDLLEQVGGDGEWGLSGEGGAVQQGTLVPPTPTLETGEAPHLVSIEAKPPPW